MPKECKTFELTNVDADGSVLDHGRYFEAEDPEPNLVRGAAYHFIDSRDRVRSLILMDGVNEKSYGYACLLTYHELGHVLDMEKGINFNLREKTCYLVGAEVYADSYVLDTCRREKDAKRYGIWIDRLKKNLHGDDAVYSKAAKLVLDWYPERI